MEFIFEILFEFFGELVLQLVLQVLAEIGLQSIAAPFRRKPDPFLAAIGYAVFGTLAGVLSVWLFPVLFLASLPLRAANLVVTPLLSAFAMSLIGTWRRRRGQSLVRLDLFAWAWLFAVTMALVRFYFGH